MSDFSKYVTPENVGTILQIGLLVAKRRAARKGGQLDREQLLGVLKELEADLKEWPLPPGEET